MAFIRVTGTEPDGSSNVHLIHVTNIAHCKRVKAKDMTVIQLFTNPEYPVWCLETVPQIEAAVTEASRSLPAPDPEANGSESQMQPQDHPDYNF